MESARRAEEQKECGGEMRVLCRHWSQWRIQQKKTLWLHFLCSPFKMSNTHTSLSPYNPPALPLTRTSTHLVMLQCKLSQNYLPTHTNYLLLSECVRVLKASRAIIGYMLYLLKSLSLFSSLAFSLSSLLSYSTKSHSVQFATIFSFVPFIIVWRLRC